jgi:hypothetical protein
VNQQAKAFLKAMLSRSVHSAALLQLLPATLAEEINEIQLAGPFDPSLFFSPFSWLDSIHPIWVAEAIKIFPKEVQVLFLKSFEERRAKHLEDLPTANAIPSKLSPFVANFFRFLLSQKLQEPLNKQLLPASSLNILLDLQRHHLLHLIGLLGLHDLAAELKQIVDRETLRKIFNALTQEQRLFLDYASKQPIKWLPQKMGLKNWDGTKKQLNHLIHYRGLIRLSKGVFMEDTNFKWYLCHTLDPGRTAIIKKELARRQDPSLISYFKNQILHIAKRYIA